MEDEDSPVAEGTAVDLAEKKAVEEVVVTLVEVVVALEVEDEEEVVAAHPN